LKTGAS